MKTRLTFYQVAHRYKVAPSTLYSWVNKGWITPYHHIGAKSFWFEEELIAWEEAGSPRPCEQQKKRQKMSNQLERQEAAREIRILADYANEKGRPWTEEDENKWNAVNKKYEALSSTFALTRRVQSGIPGV